MEDRTREVRTGRTSKNVVGYVQTVVGKKIVFVQFEYGKNREMSDSLLLYGCEKEGVGKEVDETMYELPKRAPG